MEAEKVFIGLEFTVVRRRTVVQNRRKKGGVFQHEKRWKEELRCYRAFKVPARLLLRPDELKATLVKTPIVQQTLKRKASSIEGAELTYGYDGGEPFTELE